MKNGSYRHGTEDGYKKYKCRCVKCVNWHMPQVPVPMTESRPPMDTPDIVPFLKAARFNQITVKQVNDEWEVTIKAFGDTYIGYGHLPDHAFYAAVTRYHATDPETGPLTLTYDQRTSETSLGRALSDGDTTGIEQIWEPDDTDDSQSSYESHETTLEGLIVPPESKPE